MTALVGPSGLGKTTLTRLIARFWGLTEGSVRIGGVDVRDMAVDDLLSMVSLVFQDVYLFDGTIEDNIRFGQPDASERKAGRSDKGGGHSTFGVRSWLLGRSCRSACSS